MKGFLRNSWNFQIFEAPCFLMGRFVCFMQLTVILLLGSFLSLQANPTGIRINEFLANTSTTSLADEDGETQDWIEIYNPESSPINLSGYYLTDDSQLLDKWAFPNLTIPSSGYLRVFASGKNRTNPSANLHTNFKLSSGGEFLALTRNNGASSQVILHQFDPEYPAQDEGISYGYSTDLSKLGFFDTPTPGSANGIPDNGRVSDTTFSVDRGFFTSPFSLAITSLTPGATIRYTTDGSAPTLSNGSTYTSPLIINKTTVIRAAAFKTGFEPTNVDTQTYIFADDVWNQFQNGQTPAGWPSGPINNQVYDYAMDSRITNTVGSSGMIDALTKIPSLSIAISQNDFTSSTTGIYSNPGGRGLSWERPASIELVNPDSTNPDFQSECGIRIRGGFSRKPDNPKHSFRLYFRSSYGDGKLNFPLFEGEGTDEFDNVDLRTAQNYSWNGDNDLNGEYNTFLRDVLSRDLQNSVNQPYTRSRYYHLYINGIYWGLYMTQERSDADFGGSYFKGGADEFDALKSSGKATGFLTEATDGSAAQGTQSNPGSDWGRLWFMLKDQTAFSSQTDRTNNYLKMQGLNPDGTRNPSFPVLLDVDNLILYMMVIGYTGNYDAPHSTFNGNNNWFAIRNFVQDDRGFAFFVHDAENTLGANLRGSISDLGKWVTDNDRINTTNGSQHQNGYNRYSPFNVHKELATTTPEYRQRFADLAHQYLTENGALTKEAVHLALDRRQSVVEQVINAEAARWGDVSRPSDPFDKADWENAARVLRDTIDTRTSEFLGHLIQGGLYSSLDAPVFSTRRRSMSPGETIYQWTSSNDARRIFYTTDGSDPRGSNNNPTSNASTASNANPSYSNILSSLTTWRFYDGTSQSFSTSESNATSPSFGPSDWKHPSYSPVSWKTGRSPFGYGSVSGLSFNTAVANNGQNTTYFRGTFNITNPDAIHGLRATFVGDDSFIAYLNGHEILRHNFTSRDLITQSTPGKNIGLEGQVLREIIDHSKLRSGTNVIAIELHNANDNDLGLRFELQRINAQSSTGVTINANPVTIKSRSFNGFTQQWSALSTATFTPGELPSSQQIVISELNYQPAAVTPTEASAGITNSDDFEFIELTNISANAVDLSGAYFEKVLVGNDIESIDYTFPPGSLILPQSSLIVVSSLEAFPIRYPSVHPDLIAGEYSGQLGNGGERIVLKAPDGTIIADFTYDDDAPWPTQANGQGATLTLSSLTSGINYSDPNSWTPSTAAGGSPGTASSGGFVGDPLLDLDGDGLTALYEYFAGSSDNVASSEETPKFITVSAGGQEYPALSFIRDPSANNVSFVVESSRTLIAPWSTSSVLHSSTNLPDGRIRLVYRTSQTLSNQSELFFRIRVSN